MDGLSGTIPARTYGALSRTETGWSIDRIEPHVAIRLKQMFPRIPKGSTPPYRLAGDTATAADLDWFLIRYPLEMPAAARAEIARRRELFDLNRAEMERILQPDYAAPASAGLREGCAVRTYQAQAIDVLVRSGGLLLGDEVGLGKTYTGVAACLREGALPAIVVCQGHIQRQWCDVVRNFTTLNPYAVLKARPYLLPPADVYVFRYSQVIGWADAFRTMQPGLAVFDEVQELRRGDDSGKGRAARGLSAAARYKLGLSATPIYNYGVEIHAILEYLRPGLLGDLLEFYREWTGGSGRIADPAALGAYLREQYAFIRRTKRDVGQQVPAVNRVVDTVDHDAAALLSIEDMAHALATRASTGRFTERGQAARELDLLVRQQTGISKARYVARFVRILVESGEAVVLVGWHRAVYDIWLEELADLEPAMYTGSESNAVKEAAKKRFVSGGTSILIMSLRTSAGLDGLQFRSSTMVFGELDWSPGVHHQLIGRLDREGQKDPVTAIFLVTDEGSDPPMMEVLGLKASEAARIVDPSLGVQASESDYGRVQALIRRYLNVKPRRGKADDVAAPAAEARLL